MLSLIHIENMAVIENCEVEFDKGFNVLTGETGAGKSIIIDSINALLGGRTPKDIVRFGAKKGLVLGVFTDFSPIVSDILAEYGFDDIIDTIHIQREISAEGKNICRINLKPVTLAVLKEIAPYLVNIHGQHDGQMLLNDKYHIDFLDSFANNSNIFEEYRFRYNEYYQVKKQLQELLEEDEKIDEKIEYLKFLIDEIELAELSITEEEELLHKKQIYQNYEKTAKALIQSNNLLSMENENNAYDSLYKVSNLLSQITNVSDNFKNFYEKSEEIRYQIEELSSNITGVLNEIDFDSEEINYIEERLDLIFSIKRKYGGDLVEVLNTYDEAKIELEKLLNIDKSKTELEKDYREKREKLIESGKELSKNRRFFAEKLEKSIENELKSLDMEKTKFQVLIENSGRLKATGIDNVVFLIDANNSGQLKPMAKIASGGELSRIMLAIKNILSKNEAVSTLIFDEVDTGVSGRAGIKIANKLYEVAQKKQVLCVTHLASIASMADFHYFINKFENKTIINKMDYDERKQEIARIVGGDNITDTSLKNAEELIENAEKSKLVFSKNF